MRRCFSGSEVGRCCKLQYLDDALLVLLTSHVMHHALGGMFHAYHRGEGSLDLAKPCRRRNGRTSLCLRLPSVCLHGALPTLSYVFRTQLLQSTSGLSRGFGTRCLSTSLADTRATLLCRPPIRLLTRLQTDASPRELSNATCGLDAKTLVVFQDLSGPDPTHPMVFEILDTIAKLVIRACSGTAKDSQGLAVRPA